MDYQTLLAQYLAAQNQWNQQFNPNGAPELADPNRGYNLADGTGVQMHGGSLDYIPVGAKAGDQYATYGADGTTTSNTIKDTHTFLDPLFDALPVAVPTLIAMGTAAGAGAFGDPSMLFSGSGAGVGSGASGFPIAEGAASGVPAIGGEAVAGASAAGAAGTSAGAAGAGSSALSTLGGKAVDALGGKAIGALAGGLLGAAGGGSSQTGNQTITTQQQIDPRMAQILYGANGNNGFLSQITGALGNQQNPMLKQFGNDANNWLSQSGVASMNGMQSAANGLMSSSIGAPQAGAASVNAPSQNGVDLSKAYQDMVYGAAGNNPYLTGAIQKGINQSNNAFGNYLQDATQSTQDLLGSIRGGAIMNGQMGSSRQGIAEGNAMRDFTKNMSRAASQFGQNNTDAAVSAQAGAYDADRNRALSAMSGLGAQQYGVAQQNAQMQQQANLANMQSQLSTNALNSQNQAAGINANSGLLNNAYNFGTNQDAYDVNKLGKVSGLLSPYTGLGSGSTTTQPLYENKVGGLLNGAMIGASIFGGSNKQNG